MTPKQNTAAYKTRLVCRQKNTIKTAAAMINHINNGTGKNLPAVMPSMHTMAKIKQGRWVLSMVPTFAAMLLELRRVAFHFFISLVVSDGIDPTEGPGIGMCGVINSAAHQAHGQEPGQDMLFLRG